MPRRTNFWKAFAMGAAAGTGAVLLPQLVGRAGSRRIIRLEKSIQIGRPVEEVFEAWTDWERLPRATDNVCDIRTYGNRSHWRVQVDGQYLEWDAITEQRIPNQAIGWKSVNGLKHIGRVTFSPIGKDTLVLITMNYVPPSRLLRPLLSPMTGHMEGLIEKVLRDFKASVESRPARRGSSERIGPGTVTPELAKTGTEDIKEPGCSDSADRVGFGGPSEVKR